MIDFEKCKKEFDKYTSNFDMNNNMINRKYYHTYRVVDYAQQISKSENLNEHDLNFAKVCALLHDIGRFKQAIEYGTYQDGMSIDHGDLGVKVLLENDYISNYLDDNEDKKICLKAVKNHNKYEIEKGMSDREIYFSKLLRDSDKLDIMITQKNEIKDGRCDILPEVIEALKNHVLYYKEKEKFIRSDVSTIVLQLCFIFDFNFKETFDIIKNNGIIEKKLEVLRKNCDEKIVSEIEETVYNYLK